MAPEVFEASQFLIKPVDVWAFGMTVYVYIANKLPFNDAVVQNF